MLRLLLALWIALCAACVHARPTGPAPATHVVLTDDGWSLAIHRYPIPDPEPGGTPLPARARPVLLAHGIASNHRSLDITADGSLARHLAAQGFDVWALDFRGHGESRTGPKGSRKSKRAFDHYVKHDAPAAIRYVRDQTGAGDVAWVGHSMGGMVAYAHLGLGGEGVGALVAIASPGSLRQHGIIRGLAGLGPVVSVFPQIHARVFGKMHAAVWRGGSPFHLDNFVFNRKNLTREERKLLAAAALENFSRAEIRTFSRWVRKERFSSDDEAADYAGNLSRIDVPALLLSGSADRIVPPANVQFVMARIGSADKTHRLFGRLSGDERDWGHVDLVAGRLAASVVFPEVAAWLDARDPARCAPQISLPDTAGAAP